MLRTGKSYFVALSASLMPLVASCAGEGKDGLPPDGRLVRVIPSTQKGAPPKSGPSTLAWQEGSGIQSFWSLKIVGNQVSYVFPSAIPNQSPQRSTWERSSFNVDESTLSDLRQLLYSRDFLDLSEEYHSDVADGLVVQVRFEQADFEKFIYCDNIFPSPVRKLRAVLKKMLADNSPEKTAEEITLEQARQFRTRRRDIP